MEYLLNINDSLKKYDETGIKYIDLFKHPELFYGTIHKQRDILNLSKFPDKVLEDASTFGAETISEINNHNTSPCGVRLRFKTDSQRLIFKVKLKRRWAILKNVNWGAYGFDVYGIKDNQYTHRTVFAPNHGLETFAESILVPDNGELCIFLPNFNTIEKFFMGIDIDSHFKSLPYPPGNNIPLLFYGNATTQGASASHGGNSYPNIVSKILNRDIINLSCSSGCIGTNSMAEQIGKIDCHSIIIDYNTSVKYSEIFKDTFEKFYNQIRRYHPDKKIILMTSANFNHWNVYDKIDDIIIKTYEKALNKNENISLINQRKLFEGYDFDLITVDSNHYTDYAMSIVAKKICEIIN